MDLANCFPRTSCFFFVSLCFNSEYFVILVYIYLWYRHCCLLPSVIFLIIFFFLSHPFSLFNLLTSAAARCTYWPLPFTMQCMQWLRRQKKTGWIKREEKNMPLSALISELVFSLVSIFLFLSQIWGTLRQEERAKTNYQNCLRCQVQASLGMLVVITITIRKKSRGYPMAI